MACVSFNNVFQPCNITRTHVQDLVTADHDDSGLEDFDKYIQEMMNNHMPKFDENEMMKDLEEQMRSLMASIEEAKKEKKDEL